MSTGQGEGSGDSKASKKKESPQDEDDSASENSKKKKNNKNNKTAKATEPLVEEKLTGDDDDNVSVPDGWTRKVVERKSGKTCGRHDVYFFSPEGLKFRSRTEIAAHLTDTGSSLEIDDFVFNVRTKGSNNIPKPKKRKGAATSPSKAKKGKEDARSTVGKKSPRKFFAELTPPKDTNRTTVAKKQPKRIFVKLFASPKKRILSDFANESHEDPEEEEEEEESKAKSPPKRGQAKKSPPPKAKAKGKPQKKPATRVLASPKKGKKRKVK